LFNRRKKPIEIFDRAAVQNKNEGGWRELIAVAYFGREA